MLKISKNVGLTDVVSTDGSNPISSQHPITGSAQEQRLWLINDDPLFKFENINIDPTGTNEQWTQLAPDNAGVAGTYLAAGVALTMANISDNGVGKPFWRKVTTPSVGTVQNVNGNKLTVNFRKFAN